MLTRCPLHAVAVGVTRAPSATPATRLRATAPALAPRPRALRRRVARRQSFAASTTLSRRWPTTCIAVSPNHTTKPPSWPVSSPVAPRRMAGEPVGRRHDLERDRRDEEQPDEHVERDRAADTEDREALGEEQLQQEKAVRAGESAVALDALIGDVGAVVHAASLSECCEAGPCRPGACRRCRLSEATDVPEGLGVTVKLPPDADTRKARDLAGSTGPQVRREPRTDSTHTASHTREQIVGLVAQATTPAPA